MCMFGLHTENILIHVLHSDYTDHGVTIAGKICHECHCISAVWMVLALVASHGIMLSFFVM